jgi:hypothetical protein
MAPRAIVTTGWKIYIFFAVFNVLAIVFVYFFCPETSQKSLEEIDFLYEKGAAVTLGYDGGSEESGPSGNQISEKAKS